MVKDVYSSYKVAFHKDKLDQLKRGELPIPIFVQWDLSNRCNLNCNFCFYHIYSLSDWDSRKIMPKETAFKVLQELKELGIKAVEWTGGGSVETHPDWKEILQRSKDLGFENALVTNGTLLDEEGLQLIKDFEWVRFSIDAATPQTYKTIKRVDLFDKAINNIKRLLEIRDPKNIIGYSFIVCKENYKEIYKATLNAKSLGCDNVRFSLAMTPLREKLFKGIWDKCVKEIELAKEEETKDFKVFAFSNRIYELALKTLSEYCSYHHLVGVIAPTGVYPCCRLKDEGKYNFGDLNGKSFKEIWYGERRKEFIKSIENGCPYDCWMTEKNNFIKYLLLDKPRHVNFI